MYTVGIDLGTTNTVVSTARKNKFGYPVVTVEQVFQYGDNGTEVIAKSTIPSVLYVKNGEHYVGQYAKAMQSQVLNNVISSSKNLIGTDFKWEIEGRDYTPELVASSYLKIIRSFLNQKYGDEERQVVVTVPASFNSDQKNATKKAMELAGFTEDITLIAEPTSAVLDCINTQMSFSQDEMFIDLSTPKNILVFDLGGGTCDVSILRAELHKYANVEELAVSHHTQLGGANFDACAVEGIIRQFEKEHKYKLKEVLDKDKYSLVYRQLMSKVENAKIAFSSKCTMNNTDTTDMVIKINVPNIYKGDGICVDFTMSLFDEYTKGLLDEGYNLNIIKPIKETLESCNMKKEDIDYVFCVGGMASYPTVKKRISKLIKEPKDVLNGMETVSRGASCYPYYISEENSNVKVTPSLSNSVFLNVEGALPKLLIEKHTKAGTPIILKDALKTVSESKMILELYSGDSVFDPNLKRLSKAEVLFPHGVKEGSLLSLKIEYTKRGILNFEAYLSDNEAIKYTVSLSEFNSETKSIDVKEAI